MVARCRYSGSARPLHFMHVTNFLRFFFVFFQEVKNILEILFPHDDEAPAPV